MFVQSRECRGCSEERRDEKKRESEVFQMTCVCHDEEHTALIAQSKCHTVVYYSVVHSIVHIQATLPSIDTIHSTPTPIYAALYIVSSMEYG